RPPAVISRRRRSRTVRTASLVAARPSRRNAPVRLDERRTSSTDGICRSKSCIFVAGTPVFHQMITGQTSQLFELIAMAPAHLQLTPIVEHEQVIAPLQRLELLYEIEVHDGATMNAPEFLWIETLFDRVEIRRSEEHTSELQSPYDLVCRLLLEKKKIDRGTWQTACLTAPAALWM